MLNKNNSEFVLKIENFIFFAVRSFSFYRVRTFLHHFRTYTLTHSFICKGTAERFGKEYETHVQIYCHLQSQHQIKNIWKRIQKPFKWNGAAEAEKQTILVWNVNFFTDWTCVWSHKKFNCSLQTYKEHHKTQEKKQFSKRSECYT